MNRFILFFFLTVSFQASSQDLFFNFGPNFSFGSLKERHISGNDTSRYLSPLLGFNVGLSHKHEFKKCRFSYGLFYSYDRINNYLSSNFTDSILNAYKTDRFLSLTTMNLQLRINRNLTSNFNFLFGYNLGYILDKNQNFIFVSDKSELKSSFKSIQHLIEMGVSYRLLKKYDISLIYLKNIEPIYDTQRNIVLDPTIYGTMGSEILRTSRIKLEIGIKI